MDQQTLIAEVEARAKAADIPMYRVCEAAGIHPTTLSRWKVSTQNPQPVNAGFAKLMDLRKAIDDLAPASEQDAAA